MVTSHAKLASGKPSRVPAFAASIQYKTVQNQKLVDGSLHQKQLASQLVLNMSFQHSSSEPRSYGHGPAIRAPGPDLMYVV